MLRMKFKILNGTIKRFRFESKNRILQKVSAFPTQVRKIKGNWSFDITKIIEHVNKTNLLFI